MSEQGWAGWLAERHVAETPAQKLVRQAMQGAERQERAELADEAERAVALEEERDRRLLGFQLAGIAGRSLGDVAEEASRAASEDDQYQEALKTIERIDKRRERRAEAMRYQSEQLARVAERSEPADPVEQATRAAHREFTRATRSMLAQDGTRAPRPKSYGAAVRALGDGHFDVPGCPDCIKAGATAEESVLIHLDPGPISDTTAAAEAERLWQGRGRVIYR